VLHELTPQQASLEEAFMELTREAGAFAHREPGARPAPGSAQDAQPRPTGQPTTMQEASDGR
jgi:ABC-2 type transport system ATP-binding protein